MSTPLRIELSYPAEELSPNKSVHHMVLSRFKKAAKIEAGWSTRFVMKPTYAPPEPPIRIHLIVSPKPTGPHMDADNMIASLKAHLDGIAQVIGVNDRDFAAPTIEWAERSQRGSVTVEVG